MTCFITESGNSTLVHSVLRDVLLQSATLRLLDDLRKELHMAYLFVFRDLTAVERLSQQMLVMKEGVIVDRFETGDLFASERHSYKEELVSLFV